MPWRDDRDLFCKSGFGPIGGVWVRRAGAGRVELGLAAGRFLKHTQEIAAPDLLYIARRVAAAEQFFGDVLGAIGLSEADGATLHLVLPPNLRHVRASVADGAA